MAAEAMASAWTPPRDGDHDRGDDHGYRAKQVAQDLQVGAAHVQALALGVTKQIERDTVRGEADDGYGEHEPGRDLGRLAQALPGLVQHIRRHPEQEDGVGDRGEDLEPQVSEGPFAGGRPARDPDRREGEADPEHVREDVGGVGEQREAVREQGADDLEEEDPEGQAEDRGEPLAMAGRGRVNVRHQHSPPTARRDR